ncbi:MAG: hypothetical protein K2Q34_08875 [Alphaproteobacteria bacterium]|nr:hypothetical protein [Alphaproteobacteria bacterium]
MMRRSTLIVGGLSIIIGLALFKTKYAVMALEQQHQQIKKGIQETNEALHVLRAEWAHLNDPSRLQILAQKYLDIAPIGSTQYVSFEDVASKDGGYDRKALEDLIAKAVADPKPFASDAD